MLRKRYRIRPERIVPEGLEGGFESWVDYRAGESFLYGGQRFLIDAVEDELIDAPDFEAHSADSTRILHCRLA